MTTRVSLTYQVLAVIPQEDTIKALNCRPCSSLGSWPTRFQHSSAWQACLQFDAQWIALSQVVIQSNLAVYGTKNPMQCVTLGICRYIVEQYNAAPADLPVALRLDVRPALDSTQATWDRIKVQLWGNSQAHLLQDAVWMPCFESFCYEHVSRQVRLCWLPACITFLGLVTWLDVIWGNAPLRWCVWSTFSTQQQSQPARTPQANDLLSLGPTCFAEHVIDLLLGAVLLAYWLEREVLAGCWLLPYGRLMGRPAAL